MLRIKSEWSAKDNQSNCPLEILAGLFPVGEEISTLLNTFFSILVPGFIFG